MTRLSSRLTVSALVLVAVAVIFGVCSPRPRTAVRDRMARTIVRVGSQRAAGQVGGTLSGDDHQADHLDAVVAAVAQGGQVASAPTAGRSWAPVVPSEGDAAHRRPLVPVATRLPFDASCLEPRDGAAPSPGRAPPTA